jgi:transcriptional regulator of acetoin/glycerol metabolism
MAGAKTHHIDWVLAVVEGLTRLPTDGVVWKSWIRPANAHGVDPGSRESPRILTVSELRVSREASSQLIEVARAELDHLYKIVRPARYVILLCEILQGLALTQARLRCASRRSTHFTSPAVNLSCPPNQIESLSL